MVAMGLESEVIVGLLFDGFLDGVLEEFLNVHKL